MGLIIRGFPIATTDRWANETVEGICSVLSQTIRQDIVRPEGTDIVVSEYGIMFGYQELLAFFLGGENLGTGEGVYKNSTYNFVKKTANINIKRLDTHTPDKVVFVKDNLTDDGIGIFFNNGQKKYVLVDKSVQGGKYQMFGKFYDDYSQTMPICANMQNDPTWLENDGDWVTDIAMAKTSVLFIKPFDNIEKLVWVGTLDTEDYGRLLLEEPLIEDYSFLLLEEDGDYSGNRLLL